LFTGTARRSVEAVERSTEPLAPAERVVLPLAADPPRGTARRPVAWLASRRGARSCAAELDRADGEPIRGDPDEDGVDGLEEEPIEPPPLIPPPLELLLPSRGTAEDPVRSPPLEERVPGPCREFSCASNGAELSANAKATAPIVNL